MSTTLGATKGTTAYLCSTLRIGALVTLTVSTLLSMSGCGVIRNAMYKTTGDVMVGFAEEHQVPFVLTTDDVGMNCTSSEALAPLLLSFGRVRDEPNKAATMVYGAAGLCAEGAAQENELRYLRAIHNQDAMAAQDALITQKRFNIIAAKRSYLAYQYLVREYGEPGGECPDLDDDIDQIVYMNGLLAGLLALNNEIASTTGLGIPKNIAAKVSRSAGCLDDDKWFGIPNGLQATVWALLPGAEPTGEDAFKRLDMAAKKGERAGVRIPHVLQAMAAYGKSDLPLVRKVMKQHVKSLARREPNPDYRFLDELSTTMLTALSDRMWTQATGHRTPIGGLGTFWDEKPEPTGEVIDLDDIL